MRSSNLGVDTGYHHNATGTIGWQIWFASGSKKNRAEEIHFIYPLKLVFDD
jgi:hypothetical protein